MATEYPLEMETNTSRAYGKAMPDGAPMPATDNAVERSSLWWVVLVLEWW